MAGPSSLIVNLRFNPPEIELVGPVLESTVLKLGTLLPRMTSLSRNRARKELPQFQKHQIFPSNQQQQQQQQSPLLLKNDNASKALITSSSNHKSNNADSNSNNNNPANNNNSNNSTVLQQTVWRLEMPCSVAHEVSQMQMSHAIFECIDEEGVWEMRDSTSFTLPEGVDYISLIFVKKPKRKEM